MKNFESLKEIEEILAGYAPSHMSSAVYSLDRVEGLLTFVGSPQNKLKVVHVAGTSGKTSTTYFIRAILEAAGQKVGLTASPHIETIRERVQIDGGPISEERFVQYFNEFYPLVLSSKSNTTYFEIMTTFAYWVFEKERVDYAVIEVGLGGRLDATNTVARTDKVCVINSIGIDHTDILGNTISAIAGEKAGIIQESNKVFTVKQEPEARVVIEDEVRKQNADLTVVEPVLDYDSDVPVFQQHNFQLALAAARYVSSRDGLQLPSNVEALVYSTAIPGRYEVYNIGEKTVVLDGAHNPQKLSALIDVLTRRYKEPSVVVAGLSQAPMKKVVECAHLLSGFSARVLYTSFVVQRDVTRYSIGLEAFSDIKRAQDEVVEQPNDALKKALLGDEKLIVVTGSLYLVSIVRPLVRKMAGLSE